MSSLQRFTPASSGQLLSHILERPELVSAVRELSPSVLSRLVERVGLEDCGELVALATQEQLAALFDADLWRSEGPGGEERFDVRRFVLWLAILGESGSAFVVQKLIEMPRDLLTLAVHRALLVIDMDALAEDVDTADEDFEQTEKALSSALCEEWEEFRLIARDPALWDDVYDALISLDRDHHETLRAILERCRDLSAEQIDEEGGLLEVLSSDDMLEGDALGDRDDRRAEQGFVPPADARSFLALAGSETELPVVRDPVTHAYFRQLGSRPRTAVVPVEDSPALTALLAIVRDAVPAQQARRMPPQLMAAGEAAPEVESGQSLFSRALAELAQTQPALHASRTEELAYLANVLIAGAPHAGRTLRPAEALEAALATCSLGLQTWPATEGEVMTLSAAVERLTRLSCDQLFRWAFRGLQSLSVLQTRR